MRSDVITQHILWEGKKGFRVNFLVGQEDNSIKFKSITFKQSKKISQPDVYVQDRKGEGPAWWHVPLTPAHRRQEGNISVN